jgi:hypothetical protein
MLDIMLTLSQAVWLKWWSDAITTTGNQRLGLYLGVYATFEVAATIFLGLFVWYDPLLKSFPLY